MRVQQTDRQTDMRVHREVSLPIIIVIFGWGSEYLVYQNMIKRFIDADHTIVETYGST